MLYFSTDSYTEGSYKLPIQRNMKEKPPYFYNMLYFYGYNAGMCINTETLPFSKPYSYYYFESSFFL